MLIPEYRWLFDAETELEDLSADERQLSIASRDLANVLRAEIFPLGVGHLLKT